LLALGFRLFLALQFLFTRRAGFVQDRIREDAARPDVNQPPLVLARHRVLVAPAQVADAGSALQIIERLRVAPVLAHVELDGALVLLAPFDQQLFFLALAFEGDAWQFAVKEERDGCRHGEHKQQSETGFPGLCARRAHEGSSSASVC
jgi:hypothetical protein